ncbi:MAG: elongation factor Ts [Saprospiraceae bacterium]|mgnify:FL=1|jgi:elongation factor Ts|uniref:translation elongation factor Ts n=1 Tax=Candidatus Brachybacter algidus TaxID=2982024 RepID=UPI001B4F8034|nr:translation elongation factor Ts [Candidatus Brachybacter algidus]MBP7305975.1 elongation factor Ts [Saprospiraceae bacterium]MBK6448611.1 elongation factor Ts [Candidatus Brachybacter algidus]MBK8601868.1 elongation factor Ts [Candidatus Brachybacter algidus]MBK9024239.1 elongation factor Ts [Candidatus Brachybacter algidus]MBK9395865.1 elongation factor Ts [Candidatus Brachybacter algidus]
MSVEITASAVKQLRDITGAGMMDCKSALIEANGDFEGAIEVLRKKGQKLSLKRADREAKEGVVIALVAPDNKKGIVIKLSSETDFVAKNEDFINLTKKFAEAALENFPATKEELLALPFEGITIGEKVIEQVGVIGEKIELANYETLTADQVVSYIHSGNRAGVLVGLNKASDANATAGKDVAMQIAAMKPVAVDKDGVNADIIAKEIEIGKEVARSEGKPEEMLEKIALGKLNKFYQESTLLNQSFVKGDGKQSVRDYLASIDKDLTVTAFKHVALG